MNNKKITKFYYLERENGRLVLRVPKWLAGHIIGKDGQRIKKLQELLGDKVHIETYEDVMPEKVVANSCHFPFKSVKS
jgi:transcription antitermination factor NusA-like protein